MKRALVFAWLILLMIVPFPAAAADGKDVQIGNYTASAERVIVSFDSDWSISTITKMKLPTGCRIESISNRAGISVEPRHFDEKSTLRGIDMSHGVVAFLDKPARDGDELLERIAELERVPGIHSVGPNYKHHTFMVPDDPLYEDLQGNFRQIYMEDAWNYADGTGAIVAVIDTGFKTQGMTDKPENLLSGYDFWGNDGDVRDYIGHGTHVANTIGEATDNGVGLAGIAYAAEIMPLKVFPDYDEGAYEDDIIDAIYYAVDHDADVINMSLGGGSSMAQTEDAIAYAIANDCAVFAATGNDGLGTVSYPAAYEDVIAVGATNRHSPGTTPSRASFSNYGTAIDLAAPGVEIWQESDFPGYGVGFFATQGTSNACPHAAGVAALMVSAAGRNVEALRDALQTTAHSPTDDWSNELGWGEIDAYEAIMAYGGDGNMRPTAIATAFPGSGEIPLEVELTAEESYDSDGTIVSYIWKLNGEEVSDEETFTETIYQPGTYIYNLQVEDDGGARAGDEVQVTASSKVQDACTSLIDSAYTSCKYTLVVRGVSMGAGQAEADCQDDANEDSWACPVSCFRTTFDCQDFRDCIVDYCEDVNIKSQDIGRQDDDGSGGICG